MRVPYSFAHFANEWVSSLSGSILDHRNIPSEEIWEIWGQTGRTPFSLPKWVKRNAFSQCEADSAWSQTGFSLILSRDGSLAARGHPGGRSSCYAARQCAASDSRRRYGSHRLPRTAAAVLRALRAFAAWVLPDDESRALDCGAAHIGSFGANSQTGPRTLCRLLERGRWPTSAFTSYGAAHLPGFGRCGSSVSLRRAVHSDSISTTPTSPVA